MEVTMKKTLLLILALTVVASVMCTDFMLPGPQQKKADMREPLRLTQPSRPDTAIISFSVNPISLLMSYYDYMIGSYNDLPIVVQPDPLYGGYFMTFHGQRTATGTRRVFYSYISDDGIIQNMNEITTVQNREGFPGVACDPVSGKPLYAWHANADTDANLEVQFAYDAFLFGAAGLISDPAVIIDNPITIQPYGTTNNEFVWPTVKVGPSPTTGMRRVYVLGRNFVSNAANTSPSENVYIAYADFNADMLEMGSNLTWSYTSIPTLNDWNHGIDLWRRPNMAFTVGDDGRIYYVGYHLGQVIASTDDLVESDLDAFVCDNYGEGTWTRVQGDSEYPSWNPQYNYGSGAGYFIGNDAVTPVPSDSLYWSISNSSHLNAAMDQIHNKINLAGIWAQQFREVVTGVLGEYYHPSIQTVKNLTYDINAQTFSVREIYPVAGSAYDDLMALPWDMDGDGLVDEYYTNPDDPNDVNNGTPLLYSWWPFPYWDSAAAGDAMMFHYSNVKITPPNEEGMMACVWQDSNRARLYNTYPTSYPELSPFADTPEIYISVSPDYGYTWTEPATLNKVETPELAGMKPMWVYPADKIKYIGESGGMSIGKLGILFFDDNSWGSYQQTPPTGQNDGGYVRFMELSISFPLGAADDNIVTPSISMLKQNYPNPFNPETTISFNLPKAGTANLGIYNSKGQLVRTLANGMLDAGDHRLTWNGKDDSGNNTASGLYFYKLSASGRTETRKMLLVK
jgi:hypothetical protein